MLRIEGFEIILVLSYLLTSKKYLKDIDFVLVYSKQ